MPGDEEAQDFFLGRKPLMLVPIGNIRQRLFSLRVLSSGKHAKQSVLPHGGIALRFLRMLHGAVDHRHELRAAAHGIHRAALHQRLDHALIQQPQVNFLAELEDRL